MDSRQVTRLIANGDGIDSWTRVSTMGLADSHSRHKSIPTRTLDAQGQERHWILEIHFVNGARQIGGFY
jgi:hypothetical protein